MVDHNQNDLKLKPIFVSGDGGGGWKNRSWRFSWVMKGKSNTESDSDNIEEFYEFEQLTQQFKDLL